MALQGTAGEEMGELGSWLSSLDLLDYHNAFVENGYDSTARCLSLDEPMLLRMGVKNQSHRETVLAAVGYLKQQAVAEEDGWSMDSWEDSHSSKYSTMSSSSGHLSGSSRGHTPQGVENVEAGDEDLPPPPPTLNEAVDELMQSGFLPPPPPLDGVEMKPNNMSAPPPPPPPLLGNQGPPLPPPLPQGNQAPPPPPPPTLPPPVLGTQAPAPPPAPGQGGTAPPPPPGQGCTAPPPPTTAQRQKPSPPVRSKSITEKSSVVQNGVSSSEQSRKGSSSEQFRKLKMAGSSLVDIYQEDDVDLDALLADLIEIEQSADVPAMPQTPQTPRTPQAHGPMPGVAPPMVRINSTLSMLSSNESATLEDDEFLKLMADMEELAKMPVTSPLVVTPATTESATPTSFALPTETSTSTNREQAQAAGWEAKKKDDSSPAPIVSPTSLNGSTLSSSDLDDLNALEMELQMTATTNFSPQPRKPAEYSGKRKLPETRALTPQSLVNLPDLQSRDASQAEIDRKLADISGLSKEEKAAKVKEMKMHIAMEKLKEANVKKVVLKAYNDDGSSKMIVVDDQMTASDVCIRLIKKNRIKASANFVLVEHLNDLLLDRRIEDHEVVVHILESWPRDGNNIISFTNKPDKYMLLKRPQLFMPESHPYSVGKQTKLLETSKRDIILKDVFGAQNLPEVEGYVHYRDSKKASWKKQYCLLRKSGLYFTTKAKSKATKDLQRIVDFKNVEVYSGLHYRKRFKAPTDFCFTLKKKGALVIMEKKMQHFSVESRHEQQVWIQCIRLAKYGNQLMTDYEEACRQMPWLSSETEEEIDGLLQLQKEEEEEGEGTMSRQRSGSLGKRIRHGTLKKNSATRTNRAATVAASEFAYRSSFNIEGLPNHSGSVDGRPSSISAETSDPTEELQEEEMTPWQRHFSSAWIMADSKQMPTEESDTKEVVLIEPSLDELSPTPNPTFLSSSQAQQDGMFTVRLN